MNVFLKARFYGRIYLQLCGRCFVVNVVNQRGEVQNFIMPSEVDIWKYFNSLADKLPDTIKPRKRKGRKRAHGQVGDAEKDKVLVEGSESASTKTNSENKSPSNLQNAQNGKPKKKKRVSEKRKERRKKYFEKLKELRIQGKLAETNNGTGNIAVGGNAEDVLNTPAAPTIDLTGDLQLKATIAADRSKRNHLNLTADYLSESVRQETAMDLSMPNPTDAGAAPNPIETGALTHTLPVIPSSPILTEPSEVVAIEANSEAGQPV